MPVTLPYEFDTTGSIKLILGGVLGLLIIVVVPGILYSLFISHRIAAVIQLLLIGTFLGWFARTIPDRSVLQSHARASPTATEAKPALEDYRDQQTTGRNPGSH